MNAQQVRVLVVEDDAEDYALLSGVLRRVAPWKFDVTRASTHAEARTLVTRSEFDVMLLDYWLDGGRTSLDLLRMPGSVNRRTPAILITGSSEEIDARAVGAGVVDYLEKGRLEAPVLERTLRHAFDRKRVEVQLRDSEQRFRGLVEAISEVVWVADPQGNLLDTRFDGDWEHLTGQDEATSRNGGWIEYIHPQDAALVQSRWNSCLLAGTPYEGVARIRRHDGDYGWYWAHAVPLRNEDGTVRQWIGILLDIDDQHRAEEALTKANLRLHSIIRTQQDIASATPNRLEIKRIVAERVRHLVHADIVAVARPAGDQFEYPTLLGAAEGSTIEVPRAGSMTGWCVEHRVPVRVDDVTVDDRVWPGAHAGLGVRSGIWVPLIHGDEVIGVLTALSRQPGAFAQQDLDTLSLLAGMLASALANAAAYEQRMAAQQQLELQAKLLESVEQAVLASDLDGRVTYWNPYAERLFGWSAAEVLGKRVRDLIVPPDAAEQVAAARSEVLTGRGFSGNFEYVRRDGSRFTGHNSTTLIHDESGTPIGMIGVCRDVTKERELEEQLRHSQKMQAVGQLAGGVAHDFNNILTAISSYAELLHDAVPDESLRHDIQEIQRAATRGADLTKQMLAFSRKQLVQPVTFDATDVLRDVEKMLRRLITAQIDLAVICDAPALPLFADRTQLEQVLVNLVVNARDAIDGAGRITVRADREDTPDGRGCMRLEVHDSGCGIPAPILSRIFEPFFTTKPSGKGTGLGLSVVHGIVEQLNGTIAVESTPGVGTRFTLRFPLAQTMEQGHERRPTTAPHRDGGERILLVEDNPALLTLCRRVLERRGYQVVAAESPDAALAAAPGQTFDLIVTDMVMPTMQGPALVERLVLMGIDVPVLYMSGYTEEDVISLGNPRLRAAFLPKPFTPSELARRVREVLDGEATGRITA